MKKRISILALVFLILFSLASCRKKTEVFRFKQGIYILNNKADTDDPNLNVSVLDFSSDHKFKWMVSIAMDSDRSGTWTAEPGELTLDAAGRTYKFAIEKDSIRYLSDDFEWLKNKEFVLLGSGAKELFNKKGTKIGDNSKVGEIIKDLPIMTAYRPDGFELFTSQKPYGVKVKLDGIENIDKPVFRRAAILMMSLIDNCDYVEFYINEADSLKVTREEAGEKFGLDPAKVGENFTSFEGLYKKLQSLNLPSVPGVGEISMGDLKENPAIDESSFSTEKEDFNVVLQKTIDGAKLFDEKVPDKSFSVDKAKLADYSKNGDELRLSGIATSRIYRLEKSNLNKEFDNTAYFILTYKLENGTYSLKHKKLLSADKKDDLEEFCKDMPELVEKMRNLDIHDLNDGINEILNKKVKQLSENTNSSTSTGRTFTANSLNDDEKEALAKATAQEYLETEDIKGADLKNSIRVSAVKLVDSKEDKNILRLFVHESDIVLNIVNDKLELIYGIACPMVYKFEFKDNEWKFSDRTLPEDGSLYKPSILKFCDGDKALSQKMINMDYDSIKQSINKSVNEKLDEIGYKGDRGIYTLK